MRILVITNMYPPHHYGGYELSCQDVVKRWRARGHQVDVITSNMRIDGQTDGSEPGVDRVFGLYMQGQALWNPPIRTRLAIERGNQLLLTRALASTTPDVVSIWNHAALSLGILKTLVAWRVPLCLVVCNDWLVHGQRWDPWARMFARRKLVGRLAERMTKVAATAPDLSGSTVCFLSNSIREGAVAESPFSWGRSTVTYTGIETADFPPSPAGLWKWRVAYVGRLSWSKGVHVVLDAFAQMPIEATLEIVGRGDAAYEISLHEQADRLGVAGRVRYAYAPRDALRDHYATADILVHPVVWDEPFGLVPLEAMACGTPVVATRTGGAAEYLRDGVNVLEVPKNDPAAVARAVKRLADDTQLRARLIDGGLKTARTLDVDSLARTLEDWHVATADGFARGEPPHAASPAERLAAAGLIDAGERDS